MKIFYLLVIFLFGFHAYVIDQETQHAIEKKKVSEPEGVGLTAADFERGDKLILEPPDKDAPFPFENGDVIDPEENEILKKRTSKRGVALNLLWANKTVPYLITTGFYDNETALIARAISEFRRKTCIRWTPRTTQKDYVFFGKAWSCSSYLGKQGGCQLIMIKPSACFHFTTLLHEMMHTLGFVHEHQRHDRDDYVFINTSNLVKSRKRVKINIIGIEPGVTAIGDYDFKSVMHYSSKAFSINQYATIVPKNSSNVIQKGATFSDGDVVKINHVYKCDSSIPMWKLQGRTRP